MRIGAVLLALVISAHGGQNEPVLDLATERVTAANALREFRSGNDAALAELLESAERMAKLNRPDVRAAVEFYRGLTSDERKAGLEAEKRYEALWAQVRASVGASPEVWRPRREKIVAELEQLIEETRNSPDPTPAAGALALLARLEEQRAREDDTLTSEERAAHLSRSEAKAREALAIFTRAGLTALTFEPLWLLARVDDARGKVVVAREGFEDCLNVAEDVANDAFRLRALRGLIGVAEATGDRDEQHNRLRELASIREPKDDWWLTRRWAAWLLEGDERDAAVDFLAANRPVGADDLRQWHFLYGTALRRRGELEQAELHFQEVRFEDADRRSCEELDTLVWKAQAALQRGDAELALKIAGPLDNSACSASARAKHSYTVGAAHLKLKQFALAETALRGALEQGEAIESRLTRSQGESVFGELVGLEVVALLAEAVARQDRPLEAVRLAEEVQARALRGEDVSVAPEDVRAWASGFERGLLTWVIGANTTVCAHVASDGTALASSIPIGREVLHDAVRRAREAAMAGDETRARQLASEIQNRVVPSELLARMTGPGRLLVLAHGPLERMPFDLMPLAERGAVSVLPGLAESSPGAALDFKSLEHWSILGDPTSIDGSGVLPGARAEVESLARLVGGNARTGDAFDRSALLDALRSGRALHIATHLVTDCSGDQNKSVEAGLLLARGTFLCSREIREEARELPIAVLAACQTAEGSFNDSQALASVSNAFLSSGTRNLCVTLWPIEDSAARRWSEAFHQALAKGLRPSEAAIAAREALRREAVPVSEWAAFRFAGRD